MRTRFQNTLTIAGVVVGLSLSGCSAEPSPPASTTGPSSTGEPTPPPAPSPTGPTTEATEPTPSEVDLSSVELAYEVFADGFESPILALPRPGTDQVWVVEQPGRIAAVSPDGGRDEVADFSHLVDFGGEKGLLGLAFAPDHATSGDFVVHYSAADRDGDTRVERWSFQPQVGAERGSVVLEVEQPAANHNGGMIQFGPDGMLYVALGDGGAANDRFGNGQRADTLLGTILRLDLSAEPYAVPDDNPFVDGQTPDGEPARGEVWLYGLRNPWRTWIDDGRMWIGDVGQGRTEEVDVVGLDQGGGNLGWPIREGSGCFEASECRSDGLVMPILDYGRDGGACSITGGVVNRGPAVPELVGHWFYSDFCAGFLRSVRVDQAGTAVDAMDWTEQVGVPTQVLSFGLDHEGNVLVCGADGVIRRIVTA